jgi:hypothetical protein
MRTANDFTTPARRQCEALFTFEPTVAMLPDGTPITASLDGDARPISVHAMTSLGLVTADANGVAFDFCDEIQSFYTHARLDAVRAFLAGDALDRIIAAGRLWDVTWPNEIIDQVIGVALGECAAGDALQTQRDTLPVERSGALDMYASAIAQLPRAVLETMRDWPAVDPPRAPAPPAPVSALDAYAERDAARGAELKAMYQTPRATWPMVHRAAGLMVDLSVLLKNTLDADRADRLAGLLETISALDTTQQIAVIDALLVARGI